MTTKVSKLTAISYSHKGKNSQQYWLCACTCGTEKILRKNKVDANETVSCGCANQLKGVTHGESNKIRTTTEYRRWAHMLQRCNNVNNTAYHNYGGRGIRVCTEWYDFANFLADMGRCPDGFTLDRIDNNGDYTKNNCRWTTWKVQNRNKGRTLS